MPSVYDADAFETRVHYAASHIARGRRSTRHFDTCFEMWDGDLVAEALYRRVLKNPDTKLAQRLWRYIGRNLVEKNHATLKDIPRRKFAEEAAKMRERKRAEFPASMAGNTAHRDPVP